jgi:predicted nucleotidyltransferase component of viral defense system
VTGRGTLVSDLGASVRQRLLNRSRAQQRPFQELLQYFAMERFLYRLSKSAFSDRFVLKGALLLTAWRAPLSRPTMDIDLAGRTSHEPEHIAELMRAVCATAAEPDGIEFVPASVGVSRIKEGADYEGVRVRFHATLARARIPMQIDIGFGDVIVPAPRELEYPALLDFPAPVLLAYPRETVVAEKLEALTKLGLLNSRMKDYYDLALLSRMYPFNGELLNAAIGATFRHRGTLIEAAPVGLTEAFYEDPARALQWRAFVRRSRFTEQPDDLKQLVAEVRRFACPVLAAAAGAVPLAERGLCVRVGNTWDHNIHHGELVGTQWFQWFEYAILVNRFDRVGHPLSSWFYLLRAKRAYHFAPGTAPSFTYLTRKLNGAAL